MTIMKIAGVKYDIVSGDEFAVGDNTTDGDTQLLTQNLAKWAVAVRRKPKLNKKNITQLAKLKTTKKKHPEWAGYTIITVQ